MLSILSHSVDSILTRPQVALSVRATNVYEEQSLGVYLDNEEGDEEEPNKPSNVHAWGTYLAWHARRQLSFGAPIV